MKLIAIDPGDNGAIVYFNNYDVISVTNTPLCKRGAKLIPDTEIISAMLKYMNPDVVVIEDVHSSPRAGVASTGKFLYGAGVLEGVCAPYRTEFMRPQAWKSLTGLSGNQPKKASLDKLLKTRNELAPFLNGHKNKIDRADAINMGLAWLRLNFKEAV